jgi:hypothetical protein
VRLLEGRWGPFKRSKPLLQGIHPLQEWGKELKVTAAEVANDRFIPDGLSTVRAFHKPSLFIS